MLLGLVRAVGWLGDRRILRIVLQAVAIAVACFLALFGGVAALLGSTAITSLGVVDTILDVLGGLATLLLSWLLFPAVVSAVLAMFLERIAAIVEAERYPDLPPPRGIGAVAGIGAALAFLGTALLLNVLLLALLVVAPPVYPVAYTFVNGWLIGREYLELVALRHLPPAQAKALRRRNRGGLLVLGIATTWLLLIPFVNLLAPVVAVIAAVHALAPQLRRERV